MSQSKIETPSLTGAMRRNLLLLACCQAIGQAGNVMMATATALSVITFFPLRELATLPQTMQHLGIMLFVFPAAWVMNRRGRQFGFRVGSLFGMAGASLAGLGLYTSTFPLMCAGGLLLGWAVASLQMYRFAAIELLPSSYRARAISWVTSAGVVAGIIGPMLVRATWDAWQPAYLATYAGMVVLHLIVFTIMGFIPFPPMQEPVVTGTGAAVAPPRPLRQIAAQPRFIAAAMSAMVAYGIMSFLMSASPLAIVSCGLPHSEAHWVIFLHVMGMFVPAFFTGNLVTRYGTTTVMAWGTAILGIGIVVSLLGLEAWNFRIALALNGVGWNFLFVGATTLVSTCYRPNERAKAQAMNDFLVFGTTATMSFFAGFLEEHLGWSVMNWFALAMLSGAVFAVAWLHLQRQRQPALA